MGVQGMPDQSNERGQSKNPRGDSTIGNLRVLRTHNAHIRSRPGVRKPGCGFCINGMAALYLPNETQKGRGEDEASAVPGNGVAEGAGADGSGSTPLPRGSWAFREHQTKVQPGEA